MTIRLSLRPYGHAFRALLVSTFLAITPAQADMPAAELLRATHIHGLAVDRAAPDRLLIATHHGLHALDLADGTASPVSSHRDDLMGFAPHPTDPAIFYASGHPAVGGNLGVIASRDGGESWHRLSSGVDGPVDFHQMDISKADPNVLYGVYRGLQVSRDGGLTWQRVAPEPVGLIDLAASALAVGRLYAATQDGLLISADGGLSWQPGHMLRRPVSLVETAADGTVYAFMLGSGLLRTAEPSLAWQPVGADFGEEYFLYLAVDPTDPSRLYASTQNDAILASEDAGITWRVLVAP